MDIIERLKNPEKFLDRLRMQFDHSTRTLVLTTPNVAFAVQRAMFALGQFNYGKAAIGRTHRTERGLRTEHALRPFPILLALAGLITFTACGGGERDTAATRAADAAAAAVVAEQARAREVAVAAREAGRLAALWEYADVPAGKGRQRTAVIRSTNDVDTSGQGAQSVRLVFRDHPAWGRSSYLVLQAGDFNCYGGCSVTVTVDAAAPKPMAARRPATDEAIAMFINDSRSLWRLTTNAKHLGVEFPVKAGGTRTVTFDVAGLDRSTMPGWDLR